MKASCSTFSQILKLIPRTDFKRIVKETGAGVYFVTRRKDNTLFEGAEEHVVPKNRNILKDQTIRLSGAGTQEQNLRRHLGQRGQNQDLDSIDLDFAAALFATILPFRLELVQCRRSPAHESLHLP